MNLDLPIDNGVLSTETSLRKLRSLGRVGLAHLPTPLERLSRLAIAPDSPCVWVKRDDCTGLATGGNKTRKLEFLMADALAQSADTVITTGAIQSNHARQVAAASARLGLRCILVLTDSVPGRTASYRRAGNVLLDKLFGAEVRIVPDHQDVSSVMESIAREAIHTGRRPYLIPLGGSNGLGAAAYANGFLELLDQLAQRQKTVDAVIVAMGSGGTQAGLLLGAALSGWKGKIIGISVGPKTEEATERVRKALVSAADILDTSAGAIGHPPIVVNDRFIGDGYGLPTPEDFEAIKLLARKEGLLLDPVYTGKAMAGMLTLIREAYFGREVGNIVFWHTGGTVVLDAYSEIEEYLAAS